MTALAAIGVATLDYEGLPAGFADRRRAEFATRVSAVRSVTGLEVDDLGIVGSEEEAAQANRILAEGPPAAVIVNPLIAARASLVETLMSGVDAPMLIWAPADHASYPHDLTAQEAVLGSAPVGGFALANPLVRRGLPLMATEAPDLGAREITWLRAAVFARRFPTLRFALIGGEFPGMTDCHLDRARLASDLGPSFDAIDLPTTTTTDPAHASEALAQAIASVGADYDGVSIQCWSDEVRGEGGFGVTACLGVSQLLERGTPASCMGDTPTLVAMAIAEALTGGAHYTEVDAVDRHRGGILLSNGGEIDPRLADGQPSRCENQFFSGALGRGVAFDARLRPGPASLIGFTPLEGGWRVITTDGRILDDHLDGFPVPHGFFATGADPRRTWAGLVEAGLPHHAALGAKPVAEAVGLFAAMTGIEHVAID